MHQSHRKLTHLVVLNHDVKWGLKKKSLLILLYFRVVVVFFCFDCITNVAHPNAGYMKALCESALKCL